MTVTLDVAAVAAVVALPLVLLIALIIYRKPLSTTLRDVSRRVTTLSVAGVSVDLGAARPNPFGTLKGGTDLRRAGISHQLQDNVGQEFTAQIEALSQLDWAIIDLGSRDQWLSSRLYILSVLMRRYRGLTTVVLVEQQRQSPLHFLGVCTTDAVRWRLGARWPVFESALALAELAVWGHPADPDGLLEETLPAAMKSTRPVGPPKGKSERRQGDPTAIRGRVYEARIVSDDGAALDTYEKPLAAPMLAAFLGGIQRQPDGTAPGWVEIRAPSEQPVLEYAEWLDGALIRDVLGDSLDTRSLSLQDFQGWPEEIRTRNFIEYGAGDRIAIVDRDRTFQTLVDRREFLERAAAHALA